jgi:hypothetical protein
MQRPAKLISPGQIPPIPAHNLASDPSANLLQAADLPHAIFLDSVGYPV